MPQLNENDEEEMDKAEDGLREIIHNHGALSLIS